MSDIQQLYSSHLPEVQTYINPIDISDEDYKKKWENYSFSTKMTPEEKTKYITDKGEYVRSKPANKLQVFFTRFLIIVLLHFICFILPRQKRPSNFLTLNKALFTNSFRCCYASISFKTLDTLE